MTLYEILSVLLVLAVGWENAQCIARFGFKKWLRGCIMS